MSSIKRIFIIGHSGAGKGVLAHAVANLTFGLFFQSDKTGMSLKTTLDTTQERSLRPNFS